MNEDQFVRAHKRKITTAYRVTINYLETHKDTILIAALLLGGSWKVDKNKLSIMGLLDDDLVDPDGSVHSSHIASLTET